MKRLLLLALALLCVGSLAAQEEFSEPWPRLSPSGYAWDYISVNEVRELLREHEVSETDDSDWSALMYAARNSQNPEVLRILIEAGAQVNRQNERGETPLLLAAGSSNFGLGSAPKLELLLEFGADVSAKNQVGMTALMMAARENGVAEIEALLGAGAEVSATDQFGRTSLMHAAMLGSEPLVVRRLVEAGADPNARTVYGETPLTLAARSRNATPAVVGALLDLTEEVGATDDTGKTAWDYMQENATLRGSAVYRQLRERAAR